MRGFAVAAAFVLLSCAAPPPVDPLEAKARDGDPVAACQLAARSLHSCALEKQRWERGDLSARPACMDDGISEKQQNYLDAALKNLENSGKGTLAFRMQHIHLLTEQLGLAIAPGDRMVEATASLEQECIKMEGSLGSLMWQSAQPLG